MILRKKDYYIYTPKIVYINSNNVHRLQRWYYLLSSWRCELDEQTLNEIVELEKEFKHNLLIHSEKPYSKHTIASYRLRTKFRRERFHINFPLSPPLNITPETRKVVQGMINEVFKDCDWL